MRPRWLSTLVLLALGACGSAGSPAPAPGGPTNATPTPGTLSTTGSESVTIGDYYSSNWRGDGFQGTSLRVWTPAGDSFFFRWTTTAGNQIGRIGRTHPSPALGVRVDDVRPGTVLSTTAEAKDVAAGGFHIWSIYGWTHSEYSGWVSPNGFVHDMPWGTPNQTQWVIEARSPSWTGAVDLSKAFAFWRSRGLPNEYVVDLTWALEAGAGAGSTSGEVQLTRIVVPALAR